MNQVHSAGRRILAGAGLVAALVFWACGADPVKGGGGAANGGAGGSGGKIDLRTDGGGSAANGGTGAGARSGPLPTADANCGEQKNQTTRGVADVMLVLDKSGSMTNTTVDTSTGVRSTRYEAVTAALDKTLPATNSTINWGLVLYPAGGGCNAGTVTVPVAPDNAAAVKRAYDRQRPSGYTPTAASVKSAVDALQKLNDGNPKYIVLATDGQPNCQAGAKDNTPDDQGAIDAVKAAAKAGIPVFVVGLNVVGDSQADQNAPAVLNAMAEAGGRPSGDPQNKFYKANNASELAAAMSNIGNQIATCLFKLPSAPPVPTNVLVVYDDGTRALPGPSRWEYTDSSNTSIQIKGEACDKVMNGTYKSVQILFGCPGQDQLIP